MNEKIMNCWVRETCIRDMNLESTSYRSWGELFKQIIKFRPDCVMVANTLSILNPNLKSLPEQKFPLSECPYWSAERCFRIVAQGSGMTKAAL